jgi:hypothetical protein
MPILPILFGDRCRYKALCLSRHVKNCLLAKHSMALYIAGGAPYTTGGAAMHRLGEGCLACAGPPARRSAGRRAEESENRLAGQQVAWFTLAGRREALALEGPGRRFGGERMIERLAHVFDIDLRGPGNPYGRVDMISPIPAPPLLTSSPATAFSSTCARRCSSCRTRIPERS